MDSLRAYIAQYPRRAMVAGKVIFLAGSIMALGAVFARAGLASINAERTEAKLQPLRGLAEVYAQYPTWLVPEGPLGYSVAAVLVLVGMAMIVLAEKAQKR